MCLTCVCLTGLYNTLIIDSKEINMNRKKKINSILKKRMKKINAKKSATSKPKYIAKADRVNLETEVLTSPTEPSKSTEV